MKAEKTILRLKTVFFGIVFSILPVFGFGQEGIDVPLFPEENTNIIFIEGESAVATNFTVEPTRNFGASGSKTLQLSRTLGLQGGAAFFAEYAFYVAESGTYRFGYGGTPPGPEQDLLPSYSSPFTLQLDGGEQRPVYRENVRVAERYLPTYYWVDMGPVELTAGVHTLRVQVSEKRRFDARYLFYLDVFYLVREDAAADPGLPRPAVFPSALDSEQDLAFRTIAEYQQDPEARGELAYINSLLGDHVGALKTLRQLRLEEPDNAEYVILSAKNRLWKGDIQEGLRLYRQALEIDPDDVDTWNEAGKVAAWVGSYQESINFYTSALEVHPGNIELLINKGITHLWRAEDQEAESYFEEAEKLAADDLPGLLKLGSIFSVNGYPDRAEKVYREAVRLFPLALEPYLRLTDIYTERGDTEAAESIFTEIQSVFPPADQLTTYLDTFRTKQTLREQTIEDYRRQVEESPDNLALRELLVQTYFWNGRRREAISEYKNILVNHAYRALTALDTEAAELFRNLDFAYLYLGYFTRLKTGASEAMREITALLRDMNTAYKKYQGLTEKEGAEESEINAARDEAAALIKQSADAIAARQQDFDTAAALRFSYSGIADAVKALAESEGEKQKSFENLLGDRDWSWDRTFYLAEWEQTLLTEPQLTGHVLGTVFRNEGRYPQSAQAFRLALEGENPQPASAAGLFSTRVRQGDWVSAEAALSEYGSLMSEYTGYFDELRKFFRELQTPPEAVGFAASPAELDAPYQDLIAAYEETGKLMDELIPAIQDDIALMGEMLSALQDRTLYALESDTYLLRYELGKYLIAEDRWIEATAQLEKVLEIDPWNLDAQFRLGLVRQYYGDWKGAMRRYRAVYTQDPFYPNASTYYNILARQHPDSFTVETNLVGDTARISFSTDINIETAVTSFLGWQGSYKADAVRLYKTYGDEVPSSHQVHYGGIGFPLDLYFIDLTITPKAGLYFTSDLFRDNALSTSGSILDMNTFLLYWDVVPSFGGSIEFAPKFLTLTADYSWEPVMDTFIPARERLQQHAISLNAYAAFGDLEVPFLRYSSGRLYGDIKLVGDENVYGSVVEELNFGIHLFDVPWTTLIISEVLSFEHSKIPSHVSDNGYYAPDSVLLFKGGLLASSWISLLNQNVLGVILGGYVGGYWEKLVSGASPSLQLEANGRLELSKGSSSYYLRFGGSRTSKPAEKELEYWSLYIGAGISARPVRLLTQ